MCQVVFSEAQMIRDTIRHTEAGFYQMKLISLYLKVIIFLNICSSRFTATEGQMKLSYRQAVSLNTTTTCPRVHNTSQWSVDKWNRWTDEQKHRTAV